MTRDDIIRLAREAGFTRRNPHSDLMVMHSNGSWVDIEEGLTRFAALVASEERESCAKVCEDTDVEQFTHCSVLHDDGRLTLANAASAIRARGEGE